MNEFRELVAAIRDCADKILAGNDPGWLWTTTLHAHCGVLNEDFTIFGTPRPEAIVLKRELTDEKLANK